MKPSRSATAALLGLGLSVASGCSEERALVVATPWPADERAAIEADYRAARSRRGRDDRGPAPIRWIVLDHWDDPERLLASGRRVDILLGWSEDRLARLAAGPRIRGGNPAPIGRRVAVRTRSIPVSSRSRPGAGPARQLVAAIGDRVGLPFPGGDPRLDPPSAALVSSVLAGDDWREGYASLIESAANPGVSDRASGTSPSSLLPSRIRRIEVAAAVSDSPRPEAGAFLASLAEGAGADAPVVERADAAIARLERELLGATAVDAGGELREAWSALGHLEHREAAATILTEPPPWPPASISDLRSDPERRDLIPTLARALVDDEDARARLLDLWGRPPRTIDRALLAELARLDGGRLMAEPRFLAWLRGEWTAWARQRYAALAEEFAAGATAP